MKELEDCLRESIRRIPVWIVTNDTALETARKYASELLRQRDELRERCKRLEFMIEKGLGWDDMKNDITMPHEL
jgi:hypothetical protein